jgi:hypothetical protein
MERNGFKGNFYDIAPHIFFHPIYKNYKMRLLSNY